jgi:hypothetical protein
MSTLWCRNCNYRSSGMALFRLSRYYQEGLAESSEADLA